MNWAASIQSWLGSLPGYQRALVSAIAVVAIIGALPPTRKYAVWAGLLILAVWGASYYRTLGSS